MFPTPTPYLHIKAHCCILCNRRNKNKFTICNKKHTHIHTHQNIKPMSCTFWECFFPSSKFEFAIRMCLVVYSIVVSLCAIGFAIYCNADFTVGLCLLMLYSFQAILIGTRHAVEDYSQTKQECYYFSPTCRDQTRSAIIEIVMLILNIQLLWSLVHTHCPEYFAQQIFLIVAVGMQTAYLVIDLTMS